MITTKQDEGMFYAERERRVRGISKAALARDMGINEATINRLLKGKLPISGYYRDRFAAALGISPEQVDVQVQVGE
ncbi:MAG: helix-turn-helix transcriptional regulator [Coriobacteriia bacterium]|nr:helix-turn-helix transcriptional regulator [Coriobacteriia bacterium]